MRPHMVDAKPEPLIIFLSQIFIVALSLLYQMMHIFAYSIFVELFTTRIVALSSAKMKIDFFFLNAYDV